MPKSQKSAVTADEIVASLKRSSLPTILVEGGDDLIIFRKLEAELGGFNVDVLVAEGRNTLFEVFNRREEINNGQKIAFIADKDIWVCATVPQQYVCAELIFTDGYSIENDVFRDGNLYSLMSPAEAIQFDQEIDKIIEYYALGVWRLLNDQEGSIADHPNLILEDPVRRAWLLRLRPGEPYPMNLRNQIAADYGKLLRGKTLMALLMRQLSRATRPVRHNPQAMMDLIGNNRGPLLNRLFQQAGGVFV